MALEDLKSAQGLIQFTGQTPVKKTQEENRNFSTRPISDTQNDTVFVGGYTPGNNYGDDPGIDEAQLPPDHKMYRQDWGNQNPLSQDQSNNTNHQPNTAFSTDGQVSNMTSEQQLNNVTTLDVNSSPAETKGLQNDSNFMPTALDNFNVNKSPLSTMASGQGNVIIPGNTSNIARQAATINRGTSAGGNNLESNIFPNIKEPLARDK